MTPESGVRASKHTVQDSRYVQEQFLSDEIIRNNAKTRKKKVKPQGLFYVLGEITEL